jgi:hypothetical protein
MNRGTLALAFAALLATYVLFGPKPAARGPSGARPVSTDMRADGLGVAAGWLRGAGIGVRVLRGRYTELDPVDQAGRSVASSSGDVLITHVPFHLEHGFRELPHLMSWVRRGNTLIVVAALNDTPAWTLDGDSGVSSGSISAEISALSGVSFRVIADRAERQDPILPSVRLEQPQELVLLPQADHPYFAGVKTVLAYCDYPTSAWIVDADQSAGSGARLVLGSVAVGRLSGDAVVVVPEQRGRVIVVTAASVFANRAIGHADNARFFANLVTAHLGPRGVVWFDDAHQGATSIYNVDALARDPRLYWTLAIVLGLWFAWVLGIQKLGAAPSPPLPGEEALVETAAGLLDRHVPPGDAVRLMLDRFIRRHAPRNLTDAEREEFHWAAAVGPHAARAAAVLRAATTAQRAGRQVRIVPVRRAIVILEELLT